jgi:hypothetical protein
MKPVIVTIHQPEHLPWLGFFHKISQADLFVILDSVQFRKNYFQNRNKIRTANGWTWLTVPVKRNINTLIKDVEIDNNQNWRKKCWNSIYFAYKKAPFFSEYSNILEKIYKRDWINLRELNIQLIKQFLSFLSLEPKILKSSEMDVHGKGSKLILNICKKVDADTYISGIFGKEYLKLSDFKEAGIEVIFQEFHHPIYKQLYEPFISGMSIIDLLFNHGPDSLGTIRGRGVPVMDKYLCKADIVEERQFK